MAATLTTRVTMQLLLVHTGFWRQPFKGECVEMPHSVLPSFLATRAWSSWDCGLGDQVVQEHSQRPSPSIQDLPGLQWVLGW